MSAADTKPCIERGEHITTQRHPETDCPTAVKWTEFDVLTATDLAVRRELLRRVKAEGS